MTKANKLGKYFITEMKNKYWEESLRSVANGTVKTDRVDNLGNGLYIVWDMAKLSGKASEILVPRVA